MREGLSFVQKNKEKTLYFLLILFLPTQLGYHFWPKFSYIEGLRIDYLSPTLYLTDILFLLLFFSVLINNLGKITKQISKHKEKITIGVLLVTILVIRLLDTPNFLSGSYSLIKVLECVFLFLYSVRTIQKKENIKAVLLCLSLVIVLEVILAILQIKQQASFGGIAYFFGERFFTSETPGIANASIGNTLYLRPYATFPHPNVLAGFLLITQPILLGLFRFANEKIKKITLLAVIFAALGIALSLSRVVIILEIALFLFYFSTFLLKKTWRKNKHLKLIFLIVLFLGLIFLTFPRLLSSSQTERAVVERKALMQESFALLVRQPVKGVGIGNFLNELAESKNENTTAPLQPVHNVPIHLAVELGIPLAAFLLFLYWRLSTQVFQGKQSIGISKKESLLLLLCIFVLAFSDHYLRTLQQGQLLLAISLGWIYGSIKKEKEKE